MVFWCFYRHSDEIKEHLLTINALLINNSMSKSVHEESDDAPVGLNYLQPQCFSVLMPIFLH